MRAPLAAVGLVLSGQSRVGAVLDAGRAAPAGREPRPAPIRPN